jgi:predicted dehydrogenase
LLQGIRLSRLTGTLGSATFESNGLFLLQRARPVRLQVPGLRDIKGMRAMFTDFIQALRTGAEPAMTLGMARRDLELVEAATRPAADEPARTD